MQTQARFQLLLDERTVKTPGRHLLVLPTKPLALAVAAEWEWQVGRAAAQRRGARAWPERINAWCIHARSARPPLAASG